MTSRQALTESYRILSPYSDPQKWEYDNNLFHLDFITKRISRSDRIIDLGCGIGILALALKLMDYDVTGQDRFVFESSTTFTVIDIEGLKKVWRDNNLTVTSGDVHQAQSPNSLFDVVVSIAVIEHQNDLGSFMDGILRYVENGGMIYIATPNATNLLNRFRVLFGRAPLGNIRQFFEDGSRFTGHWREYTLDELKLIADLSGLEIVEAGNKQTQKQQMNGNWRKWHRQIARLCGAIIPGCGDTNYLWLRRD